MRFFDHRAADHCAVLEHVFQIDQIAVVHMLGVIIGIVEMDDPLPVRLYNIFRQQHSLCQVLADFSCHIVPLYTVDCRIFIGIFLPDLLIITFNQ